MLATLRHGITSRACSYGKHASTVKPPSGRGAASTAPPCAEARSRRAGSPWLPVASVRRAGRPGAGRSPSSQDGSCRRHPRCLLHRPQRDTQIDLIWPPQTIRAEDPTAPHKAGSTGPISIHHGTWLRCACCLRAGSLDRYKGVAEFARTPLLAMPAATVIDRNVRRTLPAVKRFRSWCRRQRQGRCPASLRRYAAVWRPAWPGAA